MTLQDRTSTIVGYLSEAYDEADDQFTFDDDRSDVLTGLLDRVHNTAPVEDTEPSSLQLVQDAIEDALAIRQIDISDLSVEDDNAFQIASDRIASVLDSDIETSEDVYALFDEDINIAFVDDLSATDGTSLDGAAILDTNEIYIDSSLTGEALRETLIEELAATAYQQTYESTSTGDFGAEVVARLNGEDDYDDLQKYTSSDENDTVQTKYGTAEAAETTYDISAGTYNTGLTDGDYVDGNETSTTVNAVVTQGLEVLDEEITPNDVSYEDLIDAIVADYDDAMDQAYEFSLNSFGVTFADGSAEYTADALDELQDGVNQMVSIFNQMSQMAYNVEQMYVNLEDDFNETTAEANWALYEEDILAQMTQEYNSGVGSEAVDFSSFTEAYGYIYSGMSTGVTSLGTFMEEMAVDVADLQAIEEANASSESWLNSVMDVGAALVGASTGIGAIQSISNGFSAYVAGELTGDTLLTVASSAMTTVGVNVGVGASAQDDPSSTEYEDYTSIQIDLEDYTEDASALLRTMASSSNSDLTDTASAFGTFSDQYQGSLVDLAELVPDFGVNVGETAKHGTEGSGLAEREVSGNDAFTAMSYILGGETATVEDGFPEDYKDMFYGYGEYFLPDDETESLIANIYAQEAEYIDQFAVAFEEEDFLSVREISPAFLFQDDLNASGYGEDYEFYTPFNIDNYDISDDITL